MYRAFGRTAEAIALAEQVRDVRVMTLGAYHPDTIHTLDNLGLAYQAAGQPEKALAMFQQAAAGLEKLDFAHAEAGLIVGNLCDCLEQREQFDQADVWRRKWLAAVKKRDGPDSAAYAGELAEQGGDMLRRRRYAERNRSCASAWPSSRKNSPGPGRHSTPNRCSASPCWAGEVRRGRAASGPRVRGPQGPRGADSPAVRPAPYRGGRPADRPALRGLGPSGEGRRMADETAQAR